MQEVNYIVNSDKPYPSWIKEHRVFKSMSKVDKVFPKIGLSNFSEPTEILSLNQAKTAANDFMYWVRESLANRKSLLGRETSTLLLSSGEERNKNCNIMQQAINTIAAVELAISGSQITNIVDNKVVISITRDIFSGNSSSPIFKKGQSVFKILASINQLIHKLPDKNFLKIEYENNTSYKNFSKFNVPNKEYELTFSSSGPKGAWDIATASMRGIVSCQAWTSAQSRGLIGSISSKYVGIVFISGKEDVPGYGKKMMYRSMVRLMVNKYTNIPALCLDSIYPSFNQGVLDSIKLVLERRSGLKVLCSSIDNIPSSYVIPNESSSSFLRMGEYSYLDHQLAKEVMDKKSLLDSNDVGLLLRKDIHLSEIVRTINEKKEKFIKSYADLKEFDLLEVKDESQRPKIDPLFKEHKGINSIKNILSFFIHCNTDRATSTEPVKYFTNAIFYAIGISETTLLSEKECDLWILRRLINNSVEVREKSWEVIKQGSWMKNFPAATKRLFETILSDLKKQLITSVKK